VTCLFTPFSESRLTAQKIWEKAVVGKDFSIMESSRIRLAGLTPWLAWALVHLMFLPQLQSRLRVQNQWLWSYCTGQRSSGLVAEACRG
jgi:NADH dehydrogenase